MDILGLNMHHLNFIIMIKGVLCTGVKYRFSKSHTFRKLTVFLCGYGCINCDKTDSIASMPMKLFHIVTNDIASNKRSFVIFGQKSGF